MKKTESFHRFVVAAVACSGLLIAVPGVSLAEDKTIVVVEKNSDPDAETNHTDNCTGLPAGSTKVEAGDVQQAVDKTNGALGEDDCVKNLHFRGHGGPGIQGVGDGVGNEAGKHINGNNDEWCNKLKNIKFCEGATIHLWGCNVGAGEKGACKMKEIADCTGATTRGAVNTVYAGDQEDYDGPICEAEPNQEKPECQEPTDEKAKKKKRVNEVPVPPDTDTDTDTHEIPRPPMTSEDVGCGTRLKVTFGRGDGILNTEDVGCDGIAKTWDFGEGDGLLNVPGDGPTSCVDGPGEDLGCDNQPGTLDYGEGDGRLNTEDTDGNHELTYRRLKN